MTFGAQDLDADRAAVVCHLDRIARTCAIAKELLEMQEDVRIKAEFDALVAEIGATGLAIFELLSNRALFARSNVLEAKACLAAHVGGTDV